MKRPLESKMKHSNWFDNTLYFSVVLIIRPYSYHSRIIHRVDWLRRKYKWEGHCHCDGLNLILELPIRTHSTSQYHHLGIFLLCSSLEFFRQYFRGHLFKFEGDLYLFGLSESLGSISRCIDIPLHGTLESGE